MYSAAYVQEQINRLKQFYNPDEAVAAAAELCLGWAYVFGARGEYCDPSNRRSRARDDHPTIKSKCRNFNGKDSVPGKCVGCKWFLGDANADQSKHEGRTRFFDCRGFTYWVLLQICGWKLKGAGATSQWNTGENWSEKGLIKDMPDRVCIVFKRAGNVMEHTGIHVGGGKIIHCSNGVQTGKVTDRGWTHYAVPVCLSKAPSQIATGEPPVQKVDGKPVLKRGDVGEYVTLLQTMLINHTYDVGSSGADGIFGRNTESAVKLFQRTHGLADDGVVGNDTWAALEETSGEKYYTAYIRHLTAFQLDELMRKYQDVKVDEERG